MRAAVIRSFSPLVPWPNATRRGSASTFLDRLFGSHLLPAGRWPESYGLTGDSMPDGYAAQLVRPFRRR